jgi:hypothetical protein
LVLFQTVLGLLVSAVCWFAPGFYFVRRLRCTGLEKVCGSIALSLTLVWLVAWSVYVFAPEIERPAYAGITLVSLAMLAAARRDAAALLRQARVRRALAGFAFVVAWTLVVLSIIRNYSGAAWRSDWLEHFQRSLFFLHHFPVRTGIIGDYQLPARPPAMNVLAAFVMAQAGDRFEVFQAVFALLNLLMFLPCAMALPVLARPRRPGILPLVGIFAASPVILQNATYTWTKSLAAFFVILAILLYLRGWRTADPVRMASAFGALAMGMLAHYSAGPYLVFFALHYLLFVFPKRRERWKELAWIGGVGACLLATWFGWSIAVYGVPSTFASNTSVTSSRQYEGRNLEKIAGNLSDSVIPPLLRETPGAEWFQQPNFWGTVRDYAFLTYQSNLIFCMGALGGLAALWLVVKSLRTPLGRHGERASWIALILWSVVVGIAVVGERDPLGLAHLTLVPMAVLGMTLVASRFARSRTLAWVVIVGCVIDFSMGVFLQARIEHLENTPGREIFMGLGFGDGHFRVAAQGPEALSQTAWDNWMRKHEYRLATDWGRTVETSGREEPAKAEARRKLELMKANDGQYWRGWFQRHNGEVTFLGDHFGSSDLMLAMLAVLFAGLMGKMALAVKPAVAVKPASRAVAIKTVAVAARRKRR